jgi:hypothetical protein
VIKQCGTNGGGTISSVPSTSGTSTSPISIKIDLNHRSAKAGTPINGQAIITNQSNMPVTVEQCAVDGWLLVGLANKRIQFDPAMPLVACAPTIKLLPGKNRFPIKVMTTYQECLQPGGQSVTYVPPCTNGNQLPPLPRGTYQTKVVMYGLPAGTAAPASVTVKVAATKA